MSTPFPSDGRAPCVLVTDGERGSALSIIRSLGRRGFRVIAGSSFAGACGGYSRHAARRFRYPFPGADAAGYRAAVLEELRDQAVDLFIPVTDAAILPMLEVREEVERLCVLALPSTEALLTALDKQAVLALGARLGIRVPRSEPARDLGEALDLAWQIGWPVVLKTSHSVHAWSGRMVRARGVAYARDEAELRLRWPDDSGDLLIQEYCAGTGQGVELLLRDGHPLAAFQHERLREYPPGGGASAYRRSVALDPFMFQQATRLLESLRWTGLAMVEFKVSEKGPVLMELNGRVWGSLPLAVSCGVDFPGLLADLFLTGGAGAEEERPAAYSVGRRQHNLELELKWIAAVLGRPRDAAFPPFPPRRDALRAMLQMLRPDAAYDVPVLGGDPLPGLMLLPSLLARSVTKRFRAP